MTGFGCSITPPSSGTKLLSSSKLDTRVELTSSRIIRVNNTCVVEDFCVLTIALNQATLAVRSNFANSAHFQVLMHRKTSSLIYLFCLPCFSPILFRSASQILRFQTHLTHQYFLRRNLLLILLHLPFLNRDFVLEAEGPHIL